MRDGDFPVEVEPLQRPHEAQIPTLYSSTIILHPESNLLFRFHTNKTFTAPSNFPKLFFKRLILLTKQTISLPNKSIPIYTLLNQFHSHFLIDHLQMTLHMFNLVPRNSNP